MGRVVSADTSIQAHAEAAVQARIGAEVGTLVGRVAPGKDLLLQAIRTPERDGEDPVVVIAGNAAGGGGKKGGAKGARGAGSAAAGGGSSLELDEEWVVEHAAMVERALPGGLDVVGFYVVCPAATFSGAARALSSLADAAAKELAGAKDLPAMLALHMDSVTGVLTLREAGFGQLRPAELKVAPLAEHMATVQSRYALELALPVTSKQELQAAFQAATDAAVQRLKGALGLVGGQLAAADAQLADLAAASSGSGLIPVDLLLQPASSIAFSTAGGGKAGSGLQRGRAESSCLGSAKLSGVLDCRACVHRREPAAAAVGALRADIKRSLAARLEAVLDAAEQQQEASAAEFEAQQAQQRGGQGGGAPASAVPPQHPLLTPAGEARAPLAVSLPRRAFVAAAAAGGVPYCEYLFPGEGTQAVLGRLQLLLPMPELAAAAVECQEAAMPAAAQQRSTAAAQPSGSSSTRAAAMPCMAVTAASLGVAVLAIAVGYLSLGS